MIERYHHPDKHHPVFERAEQSRYGCGKSLVNAMSFPVLMDYDVHHYELHENCNKLPILQRPALEIVAANFNPKENPLATIDNLMVAFYKAECCGHIDGRQRILAGIAIECLTKQIPYIKYGMVRR